jgi:spore coat polysaccharide biosynthesis predicted glycosyltransferase SpsG
MRYVFRADASRFIGSGHVMRLSAIAEELIARQEYVVFVGQIQELIWVEKHILRLGFSEICIEPELFNPNPETDILIIDSYIIPTSDTFILRSNWLHVISIADELTPDYICDLRIHPGLDSSWTGKSKTPILSGPRYIPIRKSLQIKTRKRNGDKPVTIAIIAGGSDPYNLVSEIARILHTIEIPFAAFFFTNLTINLIKDERFTYVPIGECLEEITHDCDLIFTTASTSSLEFLAQGFPLGVVKVVDNQEQNYNLLGQLGAAGLIGVRSSEDIWNLNLALIGELIESADLRKSLMSKSQNLIDFNGSTRIIEAIKSLAFD